MKYLITQDSTGNHYDKCECLTRFQRIVNLTKANIPQNFQTLSVSSMDESFIKQNQESLNTFTSYMNDLDNNLLIGTGLFLYGESGCGKTFLGVTLLKRAFLQDGRDIFFIPTKDLISGVTWTSSVHEEMNDLVRTLVDVDYLMLDNIDDLTKQSNRESDKTLLYNLIRERYFKGKPFIMSSKTNIEDLKYNLSESDNIEQDIYGILDERMIECHLVGDYRKVMKNGRI